jgi:multidrug resistance efflux pump
MKFKFGVSDKEKNPNVEKGVKVGYAPAKRTGYRWRWYLLLLLFLIPMVAIAWIIAKPFIFIIADGVVTTDPVELRSPAAGKVVAINVERGQQISNGNALIELDAPALLVEMRQLKEVLALLPDNTIEEDRQIIEQLKRQAEVAQEGVAEQQEFLEIYRNFKKSGVIPTHEMAVILRAVTDSKVSYEAAKANVLQVEQQLSEKALAGILTQRRQKLERQLATLTARYEELTIRALEERRVIDVLVKTGEYVQMNQPVALVSGGGEPVIFAYLAPRYFEYAAIGNKATVTLPNGDKIRAVISEPARLTQNLPATLVGPFDNTTGVLKVTLEPIQPLEVAIEGLPVELSFDYWN